MILNALFITRGTKAMRGFTLVELVLGLTIMSILMVGMASAVIIAGKAMPDRVTLGQTLTTAGEVAEQVAEEVRSALWIREHTANSIEFTIPDRDGDGLPERIRYAWEGVAGKPLTRQYNGGTVTIVMDEVESFGLEYFTQSRSETMSGPPIESAEAVLQNNTSRWNATYFTIKEKAWFGQNIDPSLPGDAVSWKITRVQFRARYRGGQNGVMGVQIRPVPDGSNIPDSTVIQEVGLAESKLGSSFSWQEIAYTNVEGIKPGQKLCLLVACQTKDADLGDVEYDNWSGSSSLYTTNAGSSWSYSSGNGMYYYVYGTYCTPGPDLTITRQYFTGVRVTLQPTSDGGSRVVTSAQTWNHPELLTGWWESGFDSNPTLDHNGDGTADWQVSGGASFTLATLTDRTGDKIPADVAQMLDDQVWSVNTTIYTAPSHPFLTPTTADVRFRATVPNATAAFAVRVDGGSGQLAAITAQSIMQVDGTQTLQLGYMTDDSTVRVRKTIAGLSDDFIWVRLTIFPDSDAVNVQVDGVDVGAFNYARFTPSSTACVAAIPMITNGAEVDYVCVRESE